MILIVAAWPPELRALGSRLRDGGGGRVERAVVGVGPVEAALGTARVLAELRPTAVVLVGTAGVYPSVPRGPAIGQAVLGKTITFATFSTARDLAYFPRPMPVVARTNARLRSRLARASGAGLADIVCPPAITRSRAAAASIARVTGAALENLEAFAVARAVARARVPFVAVFGVANQVGPRAHTEWKAHAAEAAAAACACVRAFLAGARTV